MKCLHKFLPHPSLQMLYCEHCGDPKELRVQAAVSPPRPARQRPAKPPQPTLFDERTIQNNLEADAFMAQREAEALRRMEEAGIDTSEGIEGIIARNGGTQRDLTETMPEDADSSLATTTRIFS